MPKKIPTRARRTKPATHLAYFREEAGLSQSEVARLSGLSRNTVIQVEHATRPEVDRMKVGTLKAIAEAVGALVIEVFPTSEVD